MTDMREKQPERRTLDFTHETKGHYTWSAEIEVWPYSGLKSETSYSRYVTVIMRAENSIDAHRFADAIRHTISLGHDIWQANIWSVSRRR